MSATRASARHRVNEAGHSAPSITRKTGMNCFQRYATGLNAIDALVIDLAGHNPNVLIEVGMAVAMYKGESGALIILKPNNEPWPSNLQGIVYCNYDKSLRRGLEDQAGFRAALRTCVLKVAKDRQMLNSQSDDR